MSGRSHHFLGFKQYSGELMRLAQVQNTVPQWRMNPGPLDSESNALPLHIRLRASLFTCTSRESCLAILAVGFLLSSDIFHVWTSFWPNQNAITCLFETV